MWGLLAVCMTLAGFNLVPRLLVDETPIVLEQRDITVAVSGAVNTPGSYALPWGSRVSDAVAAAGGFTLQAEQSLVNLADPLDAGEAVFVPEVVTETGEVRVSVNSATPAELDTLPGVGPATAAAIVKGRPYNSLEDLLNVKGIGPKTLEKLRPKVKL